MMCDILPCLIQSKVTFSSSIQKQQLSLQFIFSLRLINNVYSNYSKDNFTKAFADINFRYAIESTKS